MNRKIIFYIIVLVVAITGCNQWSLKTEDEQEENLKVSNPDINESYDFEIITIGTGTPTFNEGKVNASTAIKYNNNYYIVDTGEGSFHNMEKADFDYKNISGIFLTHHHLDHTTDFFNIYAKCIIKGVEDFELIGPPRTSKFAEFVEEVYLDDLLYRKLNTIRDPSNFDKESLSNVATVTETTGGNEFVVNDLTVTTSEMTHTMYDLAYRFDAGDRSVVVTGDTSYNEELITFAKDADVLVIDGALYRGEQSEITNNNSVVTSVDENRPTAFYEYGGDFEVAPHLSFEDMVTIAVEANVKTLVITHYEEATQQRIDNSIAKIKEVFNGDVIYATDMLTIPVINDSENNYVSLVSPENSIELTYPIVDTNQREFYSNDSVISQPSVGESFYGQDATYSSNQAAYIDNGDGTITDLVTDLMWAQDMGDKMTYDESVTYANESNLGGYNDWRIPSIKELYSLIQFDGQVMGEKATDQLFIDTDYFNQPLGDTSIGEREIDAQTWSSTIYVGKTMASDETVFGVNFIDGRIKGYPMTLKKTQADNQMYFRLVRGNRAYGENNFLDNKDGTITDLATGLTWQQDDNGEGLDWENALSYAENLELAGEDDWRLPNAKELQSIVNYNLSIQTSNSAAIDPIFNTTAITDIDGDINYPYFWTGTSHLDGKNPYESGVYIAFGESFGLMNDKLMDVHGAGAQRSDPKSGSESDFPISMGPQGDLRYVYNYVRCVRD